MDALIVARRATQKLAAIRRQIGELQAEHDRLAAVLHHQAGTPAAKE